MIAYLSVRNWRKYQHYTDRNPPWIKWNVEVLDDDLLTEMRPMTRLVWSLILLVAARKENVIPNDPAWLAREMGLSRQAVTSSVNQLVQGEFLLGFASKSACVAADKVASSSQAPAQSRQRQRTDTEEPSEQSRSKTTSPPEATSNESHKPEQAEEDDWANTNVEPLFEDGFGPLPLTDEIERLRQSWSSS